MALDFVDSNSDFLIDVGGAVATAAPFTTAIWFNINDLSTHGVAWESNASAGTNKYFYLQTTATSNDLFYDVRGADGSGNCTSTNTYSANVWQHAVCIETTSTDRRCVLNGDWANSGTDNTLATPSLIDDNMVGAFRSGGTPENTFFPGHLAELAIWGVALTQAEVEVLASGMSPLFVRPASLLSYVPMYGNNIPPVDRMGATTLAVKTGTPDKGTTHPPIYMPQAQRFGLAIPGGGVTTKLNLLNPPGLDGGLNGGLTFGSYL